jgi:hypothetical protein
MGIAWSDPMNALAGNIGYGYHIHERYCHY